MDQHENSREPVIWVPPISANADLAPNNRGPKSRLFSGKTPNPFAEECYFFCEVPPKQRQPHLFGCDTIFQFMRCGFEFSLPPIKKWCCILSILRNSFGYSFGILLHPSHVPTAFATSFSVKTFPLVSSVFQHDDSALALTWWAHSPVTSHLEARKFVGGSQLWRDRDRELEEE